MTVSAQSRDIQESAPLFRAKDLPVRDHARIGCRLNQSIGARKGQRIASGGNDRTD